MKDKKSKSCRCVNETKVWTERQMHKIIIIDTNDRNTEFKTLSEGTGRENRAWRWWAGLWRYAAETRQTLLLEDYLIFCVSVIEIYTKQFSGTKPKLEAVWWKKLFFKEFKYYRIEVDGKENHPPTTTGLHMEKSTFTLRYKQPIKYWKIYSI